MGLMTGTLDQRVLYGVGDKRLHNGASSDNRSGSSGTAESAGRASRAALEPELTAAANRPKMAGSRRALTREWKKIGPQTYQ